MYENRQKLEDVLSLSMIFSAYNCELGKIVHVNINLPERPFNYTWTCLNCKQPLVYLPSDSDYYPNGCFKHLEFRPCQFRPESQSHINMKMYFFENIPRFNAVKERVLEKHYGERIADVYFKLKNNKEIVVECQNSPIESKEIHQRNKFYNEKGIYVLWVLNGNGPCVSTQKSPRTEENVRVQKHERSLHTLYRGRVYYMNVTAENIIHPPYALHFTPFMALKNSDTKSFVKNTVSVIHATLASLHFNLYESKNKKLAQFHDKNPRYECVEEIKQIISRIKNQSGENDLRIPVKDIISRVEARFGQSLPYGILKLSKRYGWSYNPHIKFSQKHIAEGIEVYSYH